jgi:hypothetical protein
MQSLSALSGFFETGGVLGSRGDKGTNGISRNSSRRKRLICTLL